MPSRCRTLSYSRPYSVERQRVNYVRNSVKAVIDAYDGSTTFYVFDSTDPIIDAYRGSSRRCSRTPRRCRPISARTCGIRAPAALQADVYGLYHMTNPEVFYNREDLWTVATDVGRASSAKETAPMEPNFIVMKLPGETRPEFVEMLPFSPANRNNLIGWIAGRSDGEHYGTAIVYDFPKTRLVAGPLQIEARIEQNAQLPASSRCGTSRDRTSVVAACSSSRLAGRCSTWNRSTCKRNESDARAASRRARDAGSAGVCADIRGGACGVVRRGRDAHGDRAAARRGPAAHPPAAGAPAPTQDALIAQAAPISPTISG